MALGAVKSSNDIHVIGALRNEHPNLPRVARPVPQPDQLTVAALARISAAPAALGA
jgi:hypothetical protein